MAKFFIGALIPLRVTPGEFSLASVLLYALSVLLCTVVISLAESLSTRFRLLEAAKFAGYVLVISSATLIVSLFATSAGWIR